MTHHECSCHSNFNEMLKEHNTEIDITFTIPRNGGSMRALPKISTSKIETRTHLRELEGHTSHLTACGLAEMASTTMMVPISIEDRVEFGRALVLQGYSPERAAYMATTGILDDDGALQMLARHRIRYSGEGQ